MLQLRDDKRGIFFPGHWGLFGGGVEAGEDPATALRRELQEELDIVVTDLRPVSRFDFDLAPMGLKKIYRAFFELRLPVTALASIRLGEGAAVEAFTREQVLTMQRLTPYDAFALWFHANETRLES